MAISPELHGAFDFPDVEGLLNMIMNQAQDVRAEGGRYEHDQMHPGPYLVLTCQGSEVAYEFIKQSDGSYIFRSRPRSGAA